MVTKFQLSEYSGVLKYIVNLEIFIYRKRMLAQVSKMLGNLPIPEI